MPKIPLPLIATVTLFILLSNPLHGQFDEIAQSGQQSNSSGATGSNGMPVGLDATDAFSEVQRGDRVGVTDNTGRGFSASSVSPSSQVAGATGGVTPGGIGGGQSGLGGIGGFGGFGGFGQPFNNGSSAQATNAVPLIRTRLRSAVQVPGLTPSQIGQNANLRFQMLPRRTQLRGIHVTVQDRTVVLQGNVRDESDRRMSHLLMQLEPGISRVDNRITVQP